MAIRKTRKPRRSRLVNRSTGRVLADDARVASSFREQLVGLMGRDVRADEALGLPRCPLLHTFFVRQPLDMVFCDENGRVLKAVEGLRPFSLCGPVWGAAMVWEARAGSLAPFVQIGDLLEEER